MFERTFKSVEWVGSTKRDLRSCPQDVQHSFGFALHMAQLGELHIDAKVLKGFGGAGVVEIVEDYRGNTFRAVYTVRFSSAVYVLHVFQKKSKSGSKTPNEEMDLIRRRLREAEAHHHRRLLMQKDAGKT